MLDDYAEMTAAATAEKHTPPNIASDSPSWDSVAPTTPVPASPPSPSPFPDEDDIARTRREFGALLGAFHRAPVLVPVDEDEAPLTADHGGIRWW